MKSHPHKSKESKEISVVKDALLEIGCEELPASFISLGLRQLSVFAEESLKAHYLSYQSLSVYGTPRRLAVVLTGLASRSEDQQGVIVGPPAAMAKDAQGQWSPAAQGFARKQGVEPEDLTIQNDRLCLIQQIKGKPTRSLLAELFPQWITRLEFPKSMMWETSHFRFPRPIRWLTALYGSEGVSFSLAGVHSGRWTLGLAVQSSKKIAISHPGKYVTLLKNQCVLVEPAVREETIRRLAEQAVRRTRGQVLIHGALLQQVANLVEHPVPILGSFDPGYLDLPREVLITCLEHHQKFFPVEQSSTDPRLLPHFIGIRNGMSLHQEVVREGYERVLAARLADARFFFNQDRKSPLAQKVEALRGVTFQEKLGSMWDKKERVKSLLEGIASALPGEHPWLPPALRVAELCKADLVTDLVREFPELQGTMARLYAQVDGEEPGVAQALEEHYWPITLTGKLPFSEVAAMTALADKLDTLAGDFAVGLIPSGSADPYGLRRAAVGVLRLLEAQAWPLSVEWLIEQALNRQPTAVLGNRDKTLEALLSFMRQRLSAVLEERGFRPDEIDAVLADGIGVLPQALARLTAVKDVRARAEFITLSAAFKRAANIVRQAAEKGIQPTDGVSIQTSLLQHEAEQRLAQRFDEIQRQITPHLQNSAYREALESMVGLRDPLDRFFEGVMVMAEDPAVRSNRLALLSAIVNLFLRVADFSKLQNA